MIARRSSNPRLKARRISQRSKASVPPAQKPFPREAAVERASRERGRERETETDRGARGLFWLGVRHLFRDACYDRGRGGCDCMTSFRGFDFLRRGLSGAVSWSGGKGGF